MPDRLLFSLSRIHYRVTSHFKNEFKKQGIDLSPGQMAILMALKRDRETTMGTLSRTIEVDNAAATRLVDKLEKQGLVERRLNRSDRRQMLIAITGEGLKRAQMLKAIVHDVNRRIAEGFSEEEMKIYQRVNQTILERFSS